MTGLLWAIATLILVPFAETQEAVKPAVMDVQRFTRSLLMGFEITVSGLPETEGLEGREVCFDGAPVPERAFVTETYRFRYLSQNVHVGCQISGLTISCEMSKHIAK